MSYLDKLTPVASASNKKASPTKGYLAKLQPASSTENESNKIGTAATITDAIFGSGKIGEMIGTQKVKSDIRTGKTPGIVETDYSKLSPQAIERLKSKGVPTTVKAQRDETADTIKGPSVGQIIGSGLQSASLFIPGTRIAAAGSEALGAGRLATALSKIAVGAGEGYIGDVASNLSEGKENVFKPGTRTLIGGGLPTIGSIRAPLKNGINKLLPKATDIVETAGKIAQGTTKEAEIVARTIPKIDTTGVKTYADLSKKLEENIGTKLKQVEGEFAKNVTPVKLNNLTQTVESTIGNKSLKGKVNYVKDALKQLNELYKKTKDLPSALNLKALAQKAEKEGLTGTEINELAKEYGKNFKSKGFSKTGEALTSINDQAFENTRKGIKETARGFLVGDAAKMADKEAGDLIKTKKLTDTMVEKVNNLQQRIEPRNLVQKIGRGLGKTLDMATFGGPKAFVTKLLFPSGVGEKQLTSLDIQGLLAQNLKKLQKIEKAPESAIPTLLKELFQKKKD